MTAGASSGADLDRDPGFRGLLWRQFGAAIDMLETAIAACPEPIWSERSRRPEVWYVAYHALFWLDLYLSESAEGFAPPPPFTLDELDPDGRQPPRAYTKAELLAYLEHGRRKCRALVADLTEAKGRRRFAFGSVDMSVAELCLYNLRHVQHHAAQLNLILRQSIDAAPRWVVQAASGRRDSRERARELVSLAESAAQALASVRRGQAQAADPLVHQPPSRGEPCPPGADA